MAERFASRTRDGWAAHFWGSDACVSPVLGLHEAAAHEHMTARQTYLIDGKALHPAPAPRFSRTPAFAAGAADFSSRDAVLEAWREDPVKR
ncbi:CoA transferase [Caballeronia sp. dw_19]|uniref:CoA transferase n=1 Tax=Caballeronia sp. dw_19 TaxID=2719791 RepID=UPI00210838E6|nr:CoA transferase [Caballeronia sp. dw_19]